MNAKDEPKAVACDLPWLDLPRKAGDLRARLHGQPAAWSAIRPIRKGLKRLPAACRDPTNEKDKSKAVASDLR